MQGNASVSGVTWPYYFLLGERFGELPEDNSSSAGVSTSSGMMGSFPLSRAVTVECLA